MQNIIPSVGILVFKGRSVLLVKHLEKAEHLTGAIGLPSGRFEKGETSVDVAKRELEEETGLKSSIEDLVGYPNNVYYATIERKRRTEYFKWTVFICKKFSGELKGDDKTTPLWVKISDLEKVELLPNTKKAIEEGRKFYINSVTT